MSSGISGRSGYEWDFVSRPGGFLGLLTDLRYNKVVASLDSPALSSTATTDVSVPAPAFGFIGRGYIGDWASITGEFTGIAGLRRLRRRNVQPRYLRHRALSPAFRIFRCDLQLRWTFTTKWTTTSEI